MTMTAQQWIDALGLMPHPEGGYFKETYRSETLTSVNNGQDTRHLATSIYFLLKGDDISHFHRLTSDEIWYYHAGDSLSLHVIDNDCIAKEFLLGADLKNNEELHLVIPAGWLFGAYCRNSKGFTLVSCVVSPGFNFRDFEMPSQEQLLLEFPQHEGLIKRLGMAHNPETNK
jgi:predicted cupin superfamily sugar epimerase